MIRFNKGGEYLSIEFHDYLKEYGIVLQLTPLRTPQLSGVAKRHNRTMLDMVCTMMSRVSLPFSFWGRLPPTFLILSQQRRLPEHLTIFEKGRFPR